MTFTSLTAGIALTAAAVVGLAAEASAGAACAPGASYYGTPRFYVSRTAQPKPIAPKVAARPITPAPRLASAAPVSNAPKAAAALPPDAGNDAGSEKTAAAAAPATGEAAYTSVSAVAARLAALSSRRAGQIIE